MGTYRSHGTPSAGMKSNWLLNLHGVGRCPSCGARVELPCRGCAARQLKENQRTVALVAAELKARRSAG